jgi:hypothetical protein
MSNIIEHIGDQLLDAYWKDLTSHQGMSEQEASDYIKTPLFSRALTKFSIKLLKSSIFQEVYHFPKEYLDINYLEEDSHGFAQLSWNRLSHKEKQESEEINKPFKKDYLEPFKHLYSRDGFYYDEENEDDSELMEISEFKEKDINISQQEINLIEEFEELIPKDSWTYLALHWNEKSYDYVNSRMETKFIKGNISDVFSKMEHIGKGIPLEFLATLSEFKYLDTNRSYITFGATESKSVFAFADSPIGPLAYIQFKHFDTPNIDYGLSSAGTCIGFRQKGIQTKLIQETFNKAFSHLDIISRSSPGHKTPCNYTDHMTILVNKAKPLVLSYYQDSLIFAISENEDFKKLEKEDKCNLLRELRDFLISKETKEEWKNRDLIAIHADELQRKAMAYCEALRHQRKTTLKVG